MSGSGSATGKGPPVLESAEDLYEHAPCGYLSTLPDGRILKVNGTFLHWTGHVREELLGQVRFPDLLGMGSRLFHETHLAPLLRVEGAVREIACDLRTKEGGLLPVLLNATRRELPSPAGSGAPTTTVFRYMVLDATERRRYEKDLLEARRSAEAALKRVRDLESLLPLCAWCRRVQSDDGTWLELEDFLDASGTQVTHAICGECTREVEG